MELKGKINGVDIAFIKEGNIYSSIIPKNITGIYIVELHVADGDWERNYSNVFVRIDFQNMKVKFLDHNYIWEEGNKSYGYREVFKDINFSQYISEYTTNIIQPRYSFKEVLV